MNKGFSWLGLVLVAAVVVGAGLVLKTPGKGGQGANLPAASKAPAEAPPPGQGNFPAEVWQAIKDKKDQVEVSVTPEISKIFFIDYSGPIHLGTGTDCGPDSASFKKIRKGIKWFSFPVAYGIDASGVIGVDPASAKQAVAKGFASWDAEEHPAGVFFTEASPEKVFVSWASLDGDGGTLAVTGVTYHIITREIINASVTFDSGDTWAVYPGLDCASQGTAFDTENVAVHEIGHVNGLDHVRKSSDAALTMYPFAARGETLKRTLGTGDKNGLDSLY